MESGEGKEKGRGMRGGWGGRKKTGVKDGCGEGRRKAGRGREKEKGQGREGGKKEDSDGDREGKKDIHWSPRVHTHTVSLSPPAGWCGFQSVFAKHSTSCCCPDINRVYVSAVNSKPADTVGNPRDVG